MSSDSSDEVRCINQNEGGNFISIPIVDAVLKKVNHQTLGIMLSLDRAFKMIERHTPLPLSVP